MTQQFKPKAESAKPTDGVQLTGNKSVRAVLEKMVLPAFHKVSDLKTREERLNYVADMIEAEALVKDQIGFNMGSYYSKEGWEEDQTGNICGTVACIAGWTMLLEKGKAYPHTNGVELLGDSERFHHRAAKLLMLSDEEATALFLGEDAPDLEDITTRHAVAVIRHLAKSGVVAWGSFDEYGDRLL